MRALRVDTAFDFENPVELDALVGETIANVVARAAPRHVPVVVTLNGEYLLRKDWGHRLADNDNMVVTAVAAGDGGSDVFRSVLQIAAIVTAAWFLGPAGLGLSGWQFGAAMLAANAASGYLINAILPPEQVSAQSYNAPEAASPTYSLSASGNQPRFGQVRSVTFGRMRITPDFDTAPWTEYRGNDQYVYQLFNCGLGRYAHHRYQIEDTDWWNEDDGITGSFPDVEFELLAPGQEVTLFPAQVINSVEVASQALLGTNEEGHATIGPFVANDAGTLANVLAFDIVFPGGLYRIGNDGSVGSATAAIKIEAQPIDGNGDATGGWQVLADKSYTFSSRTPQRITEKFPVAAGRWRARVTRTDEASEDTRTVDQMQWEAMRAFIKGGRSSLDSTRLAVVMKATNQLSGLSSRRVNIEQTGLVEEFLGFNEAGEPQFGDLIESRHIRDACFAVIRNASLYRPGLPALELDWQAFADLHDTWAARADYFDMIVDQEMSVWDMLSTILACGRAHPVWIGEKISVVRDEQREVLKHMFTPRNILRGSFKYAPILPGPLTPNATIVEFFDRRTWSWNEVYCSVRGIPQQDARAKRIKYPGCTVRERAWEYGIYQDASNTWRREPVSFGVEMEGEFLTRLDLLHVSHPMCDWGQSAALRSFDLEARVLTVSQDISWSTSEQNWLYLRRKDGTAWGPVMASKGDTDRIALIDATDLAAVIAAQGDWADFLDEDDGLEEPVHVVVGAGEDMPVTALLIDAKAQGGHRVQLDAIVDVPAVYTAEDDFEIPDEEEPVILPPLYQKPVLTSLVISVSGTNYEPWVSATLTPAAGVTFYQWELSYDGDVWEQLGGSPTMLSWSGPVAPGNLRIRVTATGPGGRDTIVRTRDLSIADAPPGAVTGLSHRAFFDNAVLSFSLPKDNGKTEEGIVGVLAAYSDMTGFDPEAPDGTARVEPAASRITIPLDTPTVYARVAAYNVFGDAGLNWSSEIAIERTEIGSGALSPALQTAFENAESLDGGVVFKLDEDGKIGGIALVGGDGTPIEIAFQAELIQLSHPGIDGGDPFPLLIADEDGVRMNYVKIKMLDAEVLNALVAEIGTLYGIIIATPLEPGQTLADAKLVIDTTAPYILMRKPA